MPGQPTGFHSQERFSIIDHLHVIERPAHCISRRDLSRGVLDVLYGLKDAGYRGCLVGGGVRDLLLGKQPKDFDVATDATPEQVCTLFRRARIIGRRFRIVHVRIGRELIEVSTFRADVSDPDTASQHHVTDDAGRILRDNVYGDIGEDARRRDFTVNGLYYDISDFAIYDYVGGMADVESRTLRLIGDPETRYREDPVRMLRALRIAAKLDLQIAPATADPIDRLASIVSQVPPARLFDEILKALMVADGAATFEAMLTYGLFAAFFPDSAQAIDRQQASGLTVMRTAVANTAQRIVAGKPVTPAFIYAALLWPAVCEAMAAHAADDTPVAVALSMAQREVVARQVQIITIPKRFAAPMREIWQLQPRFLKRRGKQPRRLMGHPRFRAAYDFLLLRAEAGEVDTELADWWTQIQKDPQMPSPAASRPRRHGRGRGGRGRHAERGKK